MKSEADCIFNILWYLDWLTGGVFCLCCICCFCVYIRDVNFYSIKYQKCNYSIGSWREDYRVSVSHSGSLRHKLCLWQSTHTARHVARTCLDFLHLMRRNAEINNECSSGVSRGARVAEVILHHPCISCQCLEVFVGSSGYFGASPSTNDGGTSSAVILKFIIKL